MANCCCNPPACCDCYRRRNNKRRGDKCARTLCVHLPLGAGWVLTKWPHMNGNYTVSGGLNIIVVHHYCGREKCACAHVFLMLSSTRVHHPPKAKRKYGAALRLWLHPMVARLRNGFEMLGLLLSASSNKRRCDFYSAIFLSPSKYR